MANEDNRPSLHELNEEYRRHNAERRSDVSDTVLTIKGALDQIVRPAGRRAQKSVAAPNAKKD